MTKIADHQQDFWGVLLSWDMLSCTLWQLSTVFYSSVFCSLVVIFHFLGVHVLYVLCFYVVRPIVILHVLFYRHVRRNKDTQYSVQLALASGKFTYQVRWSWHQNSIFARITRLFGLSGSTLLLQDEILGGSQPLPDESQSLKGRWKASCGPAPSGQSATKQSSWVFSPTLSRWRRFEPRLSALPDSTQAAWRTHIDTMARR